MVDHKGQEGHTEQEEGSLPVWKLGRAYLGASGTEEAAACSHSPLDHGLSNLQVTVSEAPELYFRDGGEQHQGTSGKHPVSLPFHHLHNRLPV